MSLRRADPSSRGVLRTVVCHWVWSRNRKNEAAGPRWVVAPEEEEEEEEEEKEEEGRVFAELLKQRQDSSEFEPNFQIYSYKMVILVDRYWTRAVFSHASHCARWSVLTGCLWPHTTKTIQCINSILPCFNEGVKKFMMFYDTVLTKIAWQESSKIFLTYFM